MRPDYGRKTAQSCNILKGKLLESETLVEQAARNTKEQFAASPDLTRELMNAIIDALEPTPP